VMSMSATVYRLPSLSLVIGDLRRPRGNTGFIQS
jgi:hypothetical protein